MITIQSRFPSFLKIRFYSILQVLLVETGDDENIDYNIPGVPTNEYRPILWNYRTERNGYSCLSRPSGSCEVKTGKVLGGSSVTNDMKYTRGSKVDYDGWHNTGTLASLEWKFENLIDDFKYSEDNGKIILLEITLSLCLFSNKIDLI